MNPACGEATSCSGFPVFVTMWGQLRPLGGMLLARLAGIRAPARLSTLLLNPHRGRAGLGEPPRTRVLSGGGVKPGGVGPQPNPLDVPQPPAAFKGRRDDRGPPRGPRREGLGHRRGAAGSGRGQGRSRPRGGGRPGPGVEP